jgi:tRNA uridine 5-carboxymethylaminomethyl modification enzyme
MMTSRSEYRLLLRQDNADQRLTPLGNEIGLITPEIYEYFRAKQRLISEEIKRLKNTTVAPSEALNRKLEDLGTSPISTGIRLSELIKRPQVSYNDLKDFDRERRDLSAEVTEEAEITIEYEGYIKIQEEAAARMRALEGKLLPPDIDYESIKGLSLEAREKLTKIAPRTFGEASRISGVSPADMTVISLYLSR